MKGEFLKLETVKEMADLVNENKELKNKIEELEKELEYLNSVIKDMRPNDSDKSFYCYQRNCIEEKIKELEESDKE